MGIILIIYSEVINPFMRRFSSISFLVLMLLAFLYACGGNNSFRSFEPPGNSRLNISVIATIPMVSEWVNIVSGSRIDVDSIMPFSVNPHSYQPGGKDIAKISESEVIFAIGLDYEEAWLTKLIDNYPDIRMINLGESVLPINRNAEKHNLGHGRYDPHFWFDPNRVSKAVSKIAKVLSGIDSEGSVYYEARATEYINQLNALDAFMALELKKISGPIMTEHESLGYLADRYGVEILRAVIPNANPEVGLTPQDLVSAIQSISEYEVEAIFLEEEVNSGVAETVSKETGIRLVSGLSVETFKSDQTYIDFMRHNIEVIVSNLSG